MITIPFVLQSIKHFLFQLNAWLSPTGCLLTATFFLFLLFFLKIIFSDKKQPAQSQPTLSPVQSSKAHEYNAIAGEDVMTAQLDLARAFLEMGKTTEAHTILKEVSLQGNSDQRLEALKLLAKNI